MVTATAVFNFTQMPNSTVVKISSIVVYNYVYLSNYLLNKYKCEIPLTHSIITKS